MGSETAGWERGEKARESGSKEDDKLESCSRQVAFQLVGPTPAQKGGLDPAEPLASGFHFSLSALRLAKLCAHLIKWLSVGSWGSGGPRPGPVTPPDSITRRGLTTRAPAPGRKPGGGGGRRRTRPAASGNSRVSARQRRAPRGEAVADRWRLRTGNAHCAPQLPNRPAVRPPATRSVRGSARGRWWVRSLRPFPRPPSPPRSLLPDPALLSPFRLRHPPAPHSQDENALPGTTQQRLDGFGHGPAIADPQHHLQPLRLGESLPAAALLASVTAAPLCLNGSRRAPLRTRRAASQALALGCREPPTPTPSYRRAAGTTER